MARTKRSWPLAFVSLNLWQPLAVLVHSEATFCPSSGTETSVGVHLVSLEQYLKQELDSIHAQALVAMPDYCHLSTCSSSTVNSL